MIEQLSDTITLYLGNCLDILPTITGVTHVITDPPYEHHMHDREQIIHRTDGAKERAVLDFDSIEGIREDAARLMTKSSNGWLLVFATTEGVAPWRDAIEAAGARYKRACVWVKPDSAPQFNAQGPALGHECIITAWCAAGHSRWNGGGRRGVFTHLVNPSSRQGEHKTEKPISLMCELVTLFTNPLDTICDPFMGSGSTGLAAHRLGRKFIGIELSPKWFDLACRRISQTLKQNDLFEAPMPKKQIKLDFADA